MAQQPDVYPVQFDVDYPDRPLNRLTTFFRLFMAIPIVIVLVSVDGGVAVPDIDSSVGAGGLLFLAPLLLILFRRKYPRWWFDWNIALLRFTQRVTTYFLLLRDEYPSTDEEQAVHLTVSYPDAATELNRWLPLVKWFLAIPHYIVLLFLGLIGLFMVVFAWLAILVTQRYPKGLFDFVVGIQRWAIRVTAYAFLLTTDRYPPFSLNP